MSGKNKAAFGIFKTRSEVEEAVEALKVDGFMSSDISVLLPDNKGSQEFAHIKGTKAPEGAATGAGAGAVIGGTIGLLAGIGALTIPGIGPFIAAGPIMAALAGAGVGSAIGGMSGALVGLGVPEYEAKRYEGLLRTVVFCFQCIQRVPSNWPRQKNVLRTRAPKMFRRRARLEENGRCILKNVKKGKIKII